MIIISLAYYLIVAFMITALIRSFFFKEDIDELAIYFNLDTYSSTTMKYFLWVVYTSIGVWLLSLALPPVAVLSPIIHLVLYFLAWCWVYESYKKGFLTAWFNDVKTKLKM